jgi:hypothetical protein
MPQINFRLTEEEENILKNKAFDASMTKTDFCKKIILGYKVKSTISSKVKYDLINFWKCLQENNVNSDILDELQKIILRIK